MASKKPIQSGPRGKQQFQYFMYRNFPSLYKTFSKNEVPEAVAYGRDAKPKPRKPKLPSVNLLPPRLALEEANRRTKRGFLLLFMSVTILLGTFFIAQADNIRLANAQLKAANSQLATTNERVAEYQPIGKYFESLQNRLDIAAAASGTQIDYAKVMRTLRSSVPPGTSVVAAEIKEVTPPAPQPESKNPLPEVDPAVECGPVSTPFESGTADVIGCISFSGYSSAGIATMIQELSQSPLFVNVYAQQASNSTVTEVGQAQYSGTAALTSEAAIDLFGGES